MCQTATVKDGNATSGTILGYDQYNNATDRYEFDFGHAPAIGASCPSPSGVTNFLRHTNTQYVTGAYVGSNVNILGLPAVQTLTDGSGNVYSQTMYSYDQQSAVLPEESVMVSHDEANYGTLSGMGATRGDLTSLMQCGAPSAPFQAGSCVWKTSSFVYDVAGNLLSRTDPKNHTTSYSYADAYQDGNNTRNTFANLTRVTNARGQRTNAQYDYGTGKPTQALDLNGVKTTFAYTDPLDRLTQTVYAFDLPNKQNQTSITYSANSNEINVYRYQGSGGVGGIRTQQLYDGLGRLLESRSYESASAYISTTQIYNTLGQTVSSSNPSRPGDGLGVLTQYNSDALGRLVTITTPDGNSTTHAYSSDANGSYDLVQDPATHKKQYAYDAAGRLLQVIEDPGVSNQTTTYRYDVVDHLSGVTQGSQQRSFWYDGLGRLRQAANPESGSTSYLYDDAGNLAQRTDARNVVTTYTYDELDRILQRSYSGGAVTTPPVSFGYDKPNVPFGLGHLTSVSNTNSETDYLAYDPFGQVAQSTQTTGGQTYNFTYNFYANGLLFSEQYPSGKLVLAPQDAAGRISYLYSYQSSQFQYFVNSVSYAPSGALQTVQFANGVQRNFAYNSRLQPDEITDVDTAHGNGCGGQTTPYLSPQKTTWDLDVQLYWGANGTQNLGNNGNLYSQTIQSCTGNNMATSSSFTQTYAYDPLNRITQVSDTGGNSVRTFGYDPSGNMWAGNTAGSFPLNTGMPPSSAAFNAANNQLTTTGYDAAGNQLGVPGVCTNCLQYDAENHMVSYSPSGTTYAYDGNGQRVEKIANGVTTTYVYDALGKLAAEYTSGTVPSSPCGICFLSVDHLGSTRLVTDQYGTLVARHDFLPFAEEINGGYAGRQLVFGAQDNTDQKFTGQERDQESQLDFFQARYLSGALGRFLSPDPANAGADLMNPQSWNAYSYVWNNPLNATDPSGMDPFDPGDGGDPCWDDPFCGGGFWPPPLPPIDSSPTPAPPPAPTSPAPAQSTSGVYAQGQWGLPANGFQSGSAISTAASTCLIDPVPCIVAGTLGLGGYIVYKTTPPGPITVPAGFHYTGPQIVIQKPVITWMGKQSKESAKDMATDAPSWAAYYPKEPGENCARYAERILNEKYGAGSQQALRRGPTSEYSQIKKACERGGL